jgi:hypothetical protein
MEERGGGTGWIAPNYSRPRYKLGRMVSVTPRPRFIPGEKNPGIHCTGGWVGLRAGLDTQAIDKFLYFCRGYNSGSPVCSHYIIEVESRTRLP